jgi:DNA-binding SARP family transcriptional activator/TolB-like protein/Tfp pilus assembly protein PilF
MLGSVDLRADDGHELREALVQPKRLALLAYLAAGPPGAFHRRESLLALFWPELDEPHARDALKQAVSYLRHALAAEGEPVIVNRGADELSLSNQAVWSDVRAFETAVECGSYGEALELYRGDLLEGLSANASNDFDDWLSRERAWLRRLAADAAHRLAEKREREGDGAGAVNAARRAVALSELDEPVLRELLTLLDRVGDRAGAIQAYEAFVARLAAEYETEPAAETHGLIEEIRARQTLHARGSQPASVTERRPSTPLPAAPRVALSVATDTQGRATRRRRGWATALATVLLLGGAWWTWRARTGDTPHIDRIAVLPIENLMGPDQEYFVEAMHDAVIAELGQVAALTVISRQSVMRYKNSAKTAPEIARELRVQALVQGSVFLVADTVRIQVTLIRGFPDERQLLSRSYERDLSHVLALQKDVARDIAEQVDVTLTPQHKQRFASARPVNRAAYDAWVRGSHQLRLQTGSSLRSCIAYADTALAIVPNYAAAHALSAECYGLLPNLGEASPQATYPKAKDAASKALAIDSTLAEAHFALAWVLAHYDWDWSGAEREYRRGLQFSPGSAEGHSVFGWFLSWLGRFDEALAETNRAEELDPISARFLARRSAVQFAARRFDEAIADGRRATALESTFLFGYRRLATAYTAKRMGQQAIQAAERTVAIDSGPANRARLGRTYARFGRKDEASRILEQLESDESAAYAAASISMAYAALGDHGRALSWLDRANRQRDGNLVLLKVWQEWDDLRSEPRFQEILRRMNFPKD